MFIKDVEASVGLTKKNIRYYEECGLIKPGRDNLNDYRVYSDEDVARLKVIKFLRELNVPIREIKLLCENKLSLQECMEDRINKIKREEENYKRIKSMCLEIAKSNETFNSIDITKYFLEMNILNKEGFTMRDVKTNDMKKIRGAVFSSLIFSLFFIFLGGMISYFQMTEAEKMPWIMYGFLVFMLMIPVFGIGYNLIVRIKEIKGGEENEASKY